MIFHIYKIFFHITIVKNIIFYAFEEVNEELNINPKNNTNRDIVFKEIVKMVLYAISFDCNTNQDEYGYELSISDSLESVCREYQYIFESLDISKKESDNLINIVNSWNAKHGGNHRPLYKNGEMVRILDCFYNCYFVNPYANSYKIGREMADIAMNYAQRYTRDCYFNGHHVVWDNDYAEDYAHQQYFNYKKDVSAGSWKNVLRELVEAFFPFIVVYAKLWYNEDDYMKLIINTLEEMD